jgi:hypothetical protein
MALTGSIHPTELRISGERRAVAQCSDAENVSRAKVCRCRLPSVRNNDCSSQIASCAFRLILSRYAGRIYQIKAVQAIWYRRRDGNNGNLRLARSSLHYGGEGVLIHPPHQGVCGRHGTEGQCVTSGGLAESPGGTGVSGPISASERASKVQPVVGRLSSTSSAVKAA